jgi:hypothetical protein
MARKGKNGKKKIPLTCNLVPNEDGKYDLRCKDNKLTKNIDESQISSYITSTPEMIARKTASDQKNGEETKTSRVMIILMVTTLISTVAWVFGYLIRDIVYGYIEEKDLGYGWQVFIILGICIPTLFFFVWIMFKLLTKPTEKEMIDIQRDIM